MIRLFLPLALLVGLAGCDALEDVFEDEQEVSGTVEEVSDASLRVDGATYAVTAETEFEGYTGLDDVAVGDRVEVEYEDRSGRLVALEIEDPAFEDGEDD